MLIESWNTYRYWPVNGSRKRGRREALRNWKLNLKRSSVLWSFDRGEGASMDQKGIDNAFPLAITTSHSHCLQLPVVAATAKRMRKEGVQVGKLTGERLHDAASSSPMREEIELLAEPVMMLSKTEVTGGADHLPQCCTVAWTSLLVTMARRPQLTSRDGEIGGLQRKQKWRWRQWRCWE